MAIATNHEKLVKSGLKRESSGLASQHTSYQITTIATLLIFVLGTFIATYAAIACIVTDYLQVITSIIIAPPDFITVSLAGALAKVAS